MLKILRGADEALTMSGVVKKDGRLIQEKDLGFIKKPVLVKSSKEILFVGSEKKFESFYKKNKGLFVKSKEQNLKGGTLMPGFVESHTHSIFAGDRQGEFEKRNQGVSYQEIADQGGGIAYTVKQSQKASPNQLAELFQQRAQVFQNQGVVLLESKSGYGLNHANEVKALKVLKNFKQAKLKVLPTYLGLHALPKDQSKQDYLKQALQKTLPYLHKNNLARRADIFVETKYYDLQDLKNLVQALKRYGWGFCVHAEQMSRTGATDLAVHLGAQSVEHCVEINESDIQALASSKTVANLLPAADFYLKMAYPPARKLIDAGAKVALATDFNPGSSPTLSLNFVGVLARLEMKMSLAEVLAAYTFNAASSLGLQSQYGALAPGFTPHILHLKAGWRDLFYHVGLNPDLKVL